MTNKDCTTCKWARPTGHSTSATNEVAYCQAGWGALSIPGATREGFLDQRLVDTLSALCAHDEDTSVNLFEERVVITPRVVSTTTDVTVTRSPIGSCDHCAFNKDYLCMKLGVLLEHGDDRSVSCDHASDTFKNPGYAPEWSDFTFQDGVTPDVAYVAVENFDGPPAPTTQAAAPATKTVKGKTLRNGDIDPSLEVDDEAADKVQAWRVVYTPRGKVVHLPVFRDDYIGVERLPLIPGRNPNDDFDPERYTDHQNLLAEFALTSYLHDMNLCLIGEPGVGKTEFAKYLGFLMNLPVVILSYNESSDPDNYLGAPGFDPEKGTYFKPGPLPINWELPGIGLSDEPNTGCDAIMQSYRSMNDSSRMLRVYDQLYYRHPYHFHLMAMNPAWDFRNIGTKTMASADTRRLSFFEVAQPDQETSKAIIKRAVDDVAPEVLQCIVQVSDELKEAGRQGTIPDAWSIAQDIKVANLAADYGLTEAYKRAYLFAIDPDQRANALKLIASRIPYGVDWA